LGSLLAGAVSQKTSAPLTMLLQGSIAIIIALVFSRYLKYERLNKQDLQEAENTAINKA